MMARVRREATPQVGDPAEHARAIALRLLTHAPRSAASLKDGLVARGVDIDLAERVVARYRDVGLLDDTALAATIARTRQRERGHARRAIALELRRKGFEAADVTSALEKISDEDERGVAEAFAEKRWKALQSLSSEARSRRLVGALCRRGYSPSLAVSLVRKLEHADIWDNRTAEVELAGEE
jgi:regulatory protein